MYSSFSSGVSSADLGRVALCFVGAFSLGARLRASGMGLSFRPLKNRRVLCREWRDWFLGTTIRGP